MKEKEEKFGIFFILRLMTCTKEPPESIKAEMCVFFNG